MEIILIRGTNPVTFRSGEWAKIIDLKWLNNRICYIVEFIDGKTDSWPVYDPLEPYEIMGPWQASRLWDVVG